MVSLQFLTVFSFVSIFHFSRANYDASGRTNVAMYWVCGVLGLLSFKDGSQGQGPNQQRLLHYCQQSTVDIITLAFVYVFPAQGNGFPGTNFGNQCYGPPYVYAGPGKDPALNELQSECPLLTADIPVCQSTYGKKLILSLGGGTHTYNLTGSAHGDAFADFLWGAFGPQTKEWLKHGLPRPFDGPNNQSVEVDGFDFDIEIPSAGMCNILKSLNSAN
jgi:chitinase